MRVQSIPLAILVALHSIRQCDAFVVNVHTSSKLQERTFIQLDDVSNDNVDALPKEALGRRSIISGIMTAAAALVTSPNAVRALDMDAFIQSELSKDAPKADLTEDEALCKFGGPGPAVGAACQRAGMKKKNNMDPYGNVDRGDFVTCKREWKVIDGKYEKFDICK
mmetsp:Transcript_4761/g.7032  ORF Transcript_4761/g.7032 Transcript_4761/m.7032 type:complete len:166 (+) Transcript_4761:179-676(+)